MKKFLLLLIVASALSASSNAQGLGSLLNKLKNKTQENTEKPDTANRKLEDVGKGLFDALVETVVDGKKITAEDVSGTWKYEGAACALESDDKVAEFGAKLVTAKMEKTINEYLQKVGVKKGISTICFTKDGTYVASIGEKEFKGKYAIGEDGRSIVFSFLVDKIALNSVVEYNAAEMRLMFDADKVLEIIKKLGASANEYAKSKATDSAKSSSTATMLATMTTLLEGYNGMKLGLTLVK